MDLVSLGKSMHQAKPNSWLPGKLIAPRTIRLDLITRESHEKLMVLMLVALPVVALAKYNPEVSFFKNAAG